MILEKIKDTITYNKIFMLNDEEEIIPILQDSDYPEYFENKCHPDDYNLSQEPINEQIYHDKLHHNRLILRI